VVQKKEKKIVNTQPAIKSNEIKSNIPLTSPQKEVTWREMQKQKSNEPWANPTKKQQVCTEKIDESYSK